MEIYTLGHSAHPIDHFIWLLKRYEIEILVDVRSIPASRFHPQFIKKRLEASLAENGIRYEYLGDPLGGRPGDPALYEGGPPVKKGERRLANFPEIMKRDWFQAGILRLLEIAGEGRTVILCSEENPKHCHRHLLIGAYLGEHFPHVQVTHIRGDGSLERD